MARRARRRGGGRAAGGAPEPAAAAAGAVALSVFLRVVAAELHVLLAEALALADDDAARARGERGGARSRR